MPRYLVIHHAPGVTPEAFQHSVPAVLEGKFAMAGRGESGFRGQHALELGGAGDPTVFST